MFEAMKHQIQNPQCYIGDIFEDMVEEISIGK